MENLNLEEIIKNLASSYGFVIVIDTGRSVKVIMDSSESLKMISHVKTIVPTFEHGQRVRAEDFALNLN